MNKKTVCSIAYGKGRIPLTLDHALAEWHIIQPKDEPPLPDPRSAFMDACRNPIASPPLHKIIKPEDRVVIVTSDGTRPVPNYLLIPWILEELPAPPENITILIGTGSHRPNTEDEIRAMFRATLPSGVTILNHDAFDPAQNVHIGVTAAGAPVVLDKAYVNAGKRIVAGFIEPHFMAGYSGGPKGVIPGVAGIESIFHVHKYDLIAHPNSTWGIQQGNPLYQTIVDMVDLCPPDFLVNVTLNNDKQITGFFMGECHAAHQAGCRHVREQAMVSVPHEFPVVITSNSGYPLDQNLYQSVKGLSASARIIQPGGTIFMASECSDGVPAHGNFGAALQQHETVEDIDTWLHELTSPLLDQWQVQLLVQILKRCTVKLYSRLAPETANACKLSPITDFQEAIHACITSVGRGAPVAILPEGPITIPVIDSTP
ncbi:MAG TPA: nickel-dependent lactate racemase [Candidatus Hydrogenedentes bacterium]|nr:nickel-dependent lactate racemase [Candidatus Hydrogenedentota bacterium]